MMIESPKPFRGIINMRTMTNKIGDTILNLILSVLEKGN